MSINDWIKSERKRRCMSVREFGKFCGISYQILYDYENYRSIPSITTLIKICNATNNDIYSVLNFTTYLSIINKSRKIK